MWRCWRRVEQCLPALDEAHGWRVREIAESVSLSAEFFTLLVRWLRDGGTCHAVGHSASSVEPLCGGGLGPLFF
jgi:hypothetical protein